MYHGVLSMSKILSMLRGLSTGLSRFGQILVKLECLTREHRPVHMCTASFLVSQISLYDYSQNPI